MTQISFQAFALRAQTSSPGGVNPNPVGGPSGAGGLPVCTTKKRRKPRPVDQLPLPFQTASSRDGRSLQLEQRLAASFPLTYSESGGGWRLVRQYADRLIQAGVR